MSRCSGKAGENIFVAAGQGGQTPAIGVSPGGQTPWAMLNQLTERNLDLWKEVQQNLAGSVGHAPRPKHGIKSRAS